MPHVTSSQRHYRSLGHHLGIVVLSDTCGGLEESDAEAPEGRLRPVTDILGPAGNEDEDEKGGEEGRSAGMTKS